MTVIGTMMPARPRRAASTPRGRVAIGTAANTSERKPTDAKTSGGIFAVLSPFRITSHRNAIGSVVMGVANAARVIAPHTNIMNRSDSFHGSTGRPDEV